MEKPSIFKIQTLLLRSDSDYVENPFMIKGVHINDAYAYIGTNIIFKCLSRLANGLVIVVLFGCNTE